MSQILLVRHGQASWGAEDYDVLSSLGEKQSHVLGQALSARGVRPDLVVRGAMKRHRQTAELACAGGGWRPEVAEDDGWNEFDHVQMLSMHPPAYGEGEEMSRAEFQRPSCQIAMSLEVAPCTSSLPTRSQATSRHSRAYRSRYRSGNRQRRRWRCWPRKPMWVCRRDGLLWLKSTRRARYWET